MHVSVFLLSSGVLAQRDPDDLRVTILLYLPAGSPLDLKGLGALAKTFSDFFPETLVKAVRGVRYFSFFSSVN